MIRKLSYLQQGKVFDFKYAAKPLAQIIVFLCVDGMLGGVRIEPFDSNWNWTGKGLALLWGLLWASHLGFSNVGLKRAEEYKKRYVASAIVLMALPNILAVVSGKIVERPVTLEDILFQLTAPGIVEELAFRGVLITLLFKISVLINKPMHIQRLFIALISAGLFAVTHIGATVSSINVIAVFAGGLILSFLRFQTSSILFCIIAHNVSNVVLYFGSYITS